MLKAKVNNKYDFTIDEDAKNGIDMIEVKEGIFHIIKDSKSYTAEVLKSNYEEKSFVIRVNGNKYTVQLKDKYDHLLKELGIEISSASKVKEIKAPMPGLVVDVRVKENDTIQKGYALVVLQAMKMENILKSPADAVIKKIHIKKGDAIEKNQIMITFA
ncbi:MAG: acetyl-CoA carboxylase biotin carboxyl carrier protein subunit [Bacteroidetes bacterium]|nr:acetyl-CoA carboxylase biotin carboxyl carrier protein subunit [Bacteroidota bacterium]